MAEANYTRTLAFTADDDIVAYSFVQPTSNSNNVDHVGTAGGQAIGVATHDASDGDVVGVMAEAGSMIPIRASAAIAAGANISSTNAGLAVTSASGNYILGVALEAADSAGDYITMVFQPVGRLA